MQGFRQTRVFMDTTVTVEAVVGDGTLEEACLPAISEAFSWFEEVEGRCSRFDPDSELRRLSLQPGVPVAVSGLLFEAVRFAVGVAEASEGAFDPTVGARMEERGFDRNHRTGEMSRSGVPSRVGVSWRDVGLDRAARTITLLHPLLLDLGAVAKGLAIDLGMRELAAFPGSAIDAGGDVAVRGVNSAGAPWRIGIRHARRPEALCTRVCLVEGAVCTSGDYERRSPHAEGGSHILDPGSGGAVDAVASCSVVAPNAMLADALGTAATVMGPERAIPWLKRQGVEALLLTPALERYTTPGFARLEQCL